MSLEAERLSALIDFCHQSARLRGKPTAAISSHGGFNFYENERSGLPGISLNNSGLDGSDEIWLSVERLHETKPPEVTGAWLKPWLTMTKGPNVEPSLRESVDGKALIDAGTHVEKENSGHPVVGMDDLVTLAEYPERQQVIALHEEYLKSRWLPWSVEEKSDSKQFVFMHSCSL